MASYKTRAIILKTAPFSEADKMVTLFSRDAGKIKAIAKSARKVPSRLGGRVEPFTHAEYFIAKGRNLDIISQCQMIETFQKIRDGEDRLPAGLYILKLIDMGTSIGQPYPELFDLLLNALLQLKADVPGRKVAKGFVTDFVVLEGIYQAEVNPTDSLIEHIGRDIRKW